MDIRDLQKAVESHLSTVSGTVCLAFQDLVTGERFSVNGDRSVPSASTIKLVIMAELMARVQAGKLSLEQKITVTAEMKTGGDGILKELEPGHSFTLKEIMTLMIIVSDNQATNILIDLLGMDAINARARAMGLKQAILGRRMMDSEARKRGHDNYISANDMAAILRAIYDGTLIDEAASKIMLEVLLRQQQNGRLQLYLPEDLPMAHKCGDLDLLENDGGIIYAPDHPYILVVLTSEMPSNKEGREVIGQLSKLVYDSICSYYSS